MQNTAASYAEGMSRATLQTSRVNGFSASFRFSCACLPQCEAGQTIRGKFTFAEVSGSGRLSSYADGIFTAATYEGGFSVTGSKAGIRFWFAALQDALSGNIRRFLSRDTGAVLAAMTVGDRRFLSDARLTAYRRAGISHVLVVSGLHLALLCRLVPLRRRRDSRKARVTAAWGSIAVSLFLIGVTGASPSIVRAGCAVILCAVGDLLAQPVDSLTSLALTGAVMSAANAYAVCDLSFELSFAATAGVLLANQVARRRRRHRKTSRLRRKAAECVLEDLLVPACASLFTLPVLMLSGSDISMVSLVTNLATVWLISPILLCGITAAFCGFVPVLLPAARMAALCGGVLVRLMNGTVDVLGRVPGAHLHVDSAFPAIAVLLIGVFLAAAGLCRIPWRKALPAAMLLAVVAFAVDVTMMHGIIRIALVGNARVPAVVISQGKEADVLFRGGNYNEQAVRAYLEQENIGTVHTLIDMRMEPASACTLPAEKTFSVAELADGGTKRLPMPGNTELLLSREGSGCYASLTIGRRHVMMVSGSPTGCEDVLPAAYMLATGSAPAQIQADRILSLTDSYPWLDSTAAERVYYGQSGAALWVRPGTPGTIWKTRIMEANGWPIRQSSGS